jgi:hypothetical protein
VTRKARRMTNRGPWFRTLPAVLAAVLVSCDVTPPGAPNQTARPSSADTGDLRQRQAAFLNRIRDSDPQQRTIERAFLNEQNELGLILNRNVEMDKISDLMKAMLTQMAREFPGQDLTVLAYTPSDPPRKIGTGRLNAQTRDMTYTPE